MANVRRLPREHALTLSQGRPAALATCRRVGSDGFRRRVIWCVGAIVAAQACAVQAKTTGIKREILPAAYYENMDRLGRNSALVTAERDGRTVAHGMVLHDDSVTIATYFGRDSGPPQQEWFHLVNEVIRLGIERKSRYVNLGLGSYDAKSNVGADIEPLYVYSKSTSAALNTLMRLVPRTMDRQPRSPKQVFRDG